MRLCLMLLFSSLFCYSQNQINGFGGVRFGERLNTIKKTIDCTTISVWDIGGKAEKVRYRPEKELLDFNKYYFYLTPKTSQVYCIDICKNFDGKKEALAYLGCAKEVFERLYDIDFCKRVRKGFNDSIEYVALFREGDKSFSIVCSYKGYFSVLSSNSKVKVSICRLDIFSLGEKEEKELELAILKNKANKVTRDIFE